MDGIYRSGRKSQSQQRAGVIVRRSLQAVDQTPKQRLVSPLDDDRGMNIGFGEVLAAGFSPTKMVCASLIRLLEPR